MKKIIGLFAAAALAFGVVGCANDDGVPTERIEDSSESLIAGADATSLSFGLEATKAVSEDTAVVSASVSDDKKVSIKGIKVGSTTVTATYTNEIGESVNKKITVTVTYPTKEYSLGDLYSYLPEDLTEKIVGSTLTFTTSDSNVFSYNEDKKNFETKSVGTATVTFTVDSKTYTFEVKTDETGEIVSFENANEKTYNFVGLEFSDFPSESLTNGDDGKTVLTALADNGSKQPYFAQTTDGWKVKGATVLSPNSKRMLAEFTTVTSGVTTDLKIGNSNMSSTTALADSYNGIKITAPSAGKVTLTFSVTPASSSKTGAEDATVALFQNSAIVGDAKTLDTTYVKGESDADKAARVGTKDSPLTLTADVAAGDVYVGYYRGGVADTGNVVIYSIKYVKSDSE